MLNSESDLTVSRIIKAPPTAVWTAWKDPKHFVKWWAPAPIITVVEKHEFFAGGAFDTVMRMPDGAEHGSKGCFLEVVENERIAFTDALQGGWRPNPEAFFKAIITLQAQGNGTKYTATALHKNEEDKQKHADMGFVEGWGTCIDQLAELCLNLHK